MWNYKKHCHLFSEKTDTGNEQLHKFAEKIGLNRNWFQDANIPHYDLNETKRKLAIKMGAIEIDSKEILRLLRAK